MNNGWKPFKLKDVCEQITDGKHGDCVNEPNSGFYFLSAKDIGNGSINYENARQITEADFSETHRRTKFEPLDILFTNSGTIGRMAIAKNEDRTHRTTFQKSVAILKPNKEFVEPHYLYYLLLYDNRRLSDFAAGTAQKNLLLKDLRDFPVSIPSRPIQRRIAAILTAYDDLIENNTRRIQILEEMARRIYEEWFVRFRFPGHENVRMVESELGASPEEWKVQSVTRLIEFDPRTAVPREGAKPFVPMSSLAENSMLISNIESREGNSGSKFKNGDTLFARITPCLENGKTGFVDFLANDEAVAFGSTEYIVLRSKTVTPEFVYLTARSERFRQHAIKSMSGATGRQRVRIDSFNEYLLAHPDKETLDKFSDVVSPTFKSIGCLAKKNANLRRTRDLLLPKLISGEIDVSNFPNL